MSEWNKTIQRMFAEPEIVQPNAVHGRTEEFPSPPVQVPKEQVKPIYDDPNHRLYGPARRLHLILLYLWGDRLAAQEAEFIRVMGYDWTEALRKEIDADGMDCERDAARYIIRVMETWER